MKTFNQTNIVMALCAAVVAVSTGAMEKDTPSCYETTEYALLPAPQNIRYLDGICRLPAEKNFKIDPQGITQEQGYKITIKPGRVDIVANDEAGRFYAEKTLEQLALQTGEKGYVRCLEITDFPDFPVRGVMLDISRNKVPTMATLYNLVDMLASWKINHFQLYTEHTFAYPGHKTVWEHASPMTAAQIRDLDAYCRDRFIDLVPNQNSFGHMSRWLSHEKYRHLAEAPEFVETTVGKRRWNTLCPTDPGSIELIAGLYDDLLPNFSSRYVNVGCDETFELGQGRSKEACDAIGVGQVYLDFLSKINKQAKKHNKTIMFWADIILLHPELVELLPEDSIALAWGYEPSQPTKEVCETLLNSGHKYYVCPGVATWLSGAGRVEHAKVNIANAAEKGLEYGASGFINTDWGDGGSWEPITASYPGYAYGAGLSWANEANKSMDIPAALDLFAFGDKAGVIGQLIYDLGNAYKSCGVQAFNSSWMIRLLIDPQWLDSDPNNLLTVDKIKQTEEYIDEVMARLDQAQINRADADIVREEITHAANILRHGCHLGIARLEAEDHETKNIPKKKRRELAAELTELVGRHRKIWLYRNRPGGMEESAALLGSRLEVYISD